MKELPSWWTWDLELVDHVIDQMAIRYFSETDVREMLQAPISLEEQLNMRWKIATTLGGMPWHVILEPDFRKRRIVVVTAYPVTRLRLSE